MSDKRFRNVEQIDHEILGTADVAGARGTHSKIRAATCLASPKYRLIFIETDD
jgi:hypothetical protein